MELSLKAMMIEMVFSKVTQRANKSRFVRRVC